MKQKLPPASSASYQSELNKILKVHGYLYADGKCVGIAFSRRADLDDKLIAPLALIETHPTKEAERWLLEHGFSSLLDKFRLNEIARYLRTRAEKKKFEFLLSGSGYHEYDHDGVRFSIYVCDNKAYPLDCTEAPRVILQNADAHGTSVTVSAKTWNDDVSGYLVGNPRLLVALCVALSAFLLALFGENPYVLALVASSSKGKSTIQRFCSLAFFPKGVVIPWNGTSNGIRALIAAFRDQPCFFDDMHKADSVADIANIIMAVGNKANRITARGSGQANQNSAVRSTLIVSTEESLSSMNVRKATKLHSGIRARYWEIYEGKYGMFDDLNGHTDGRELSKELDDLAKKHAGALGREWVPLLSQNYERVRSWHKDHREEVRAAILKAAGNPELDDVTSRLVDSLSFSAFCGCVAYSLGMLKVDRDTITSAFGHLLLEFIRKSPSDSHETGEVAIEAIRAYIEQNKPSFLSIGDYHDPNRRVRAAGFTAESKRHGKLFLILPGMFRDEFLMKFGDGIFEHLRRANLLVAQEQKGNQYVKRIPSPTDKKVRATFYAISDRILYAQD